MNGIAPCASPRARACGMHTERHRLLNGKRRRTSPRRDRARPLAIDRLILSCRASAQVDQPAHATAATGWPKSSWALSTMLRRLAGQMRTVGVHRTTSRSHGIRFITIARCDAESPTG